MGFVGSSYSALVDAPSTMCFGEPRVEVVACCDEEWAYLTVPT